MDTSYLYTKTTEQLKLLAKQAGVKLPSGATKSKIIALLSENIEKKQDKTPEQEPIAEAPKPARGKTKNVKQDTKPEGERSSSAERKAKAVDEAPVQTQSQADNTTASRKRGRPAGTKKSAKINPTEKLPGNEAGAQNTESAPKEPMAPSVSDLDSSEAAQDLKAEPATALALAPEQENLAETETEDELDEADGGNARQSQAQVQESDKGVPGGDWGEGQGVLEILPDGYGFLRAENCLPGAKDVYLSQTQIRRFNLRNGDYITGKTRPQRDGDRYEGMIYVSTVNGASADAARRRPRFEDLTPIFPDSRLRLENPLGNTDLALRTIDLIAPIGKGQRGLIVSPPKAGKTVLLKLIANAITANYPDVKLMVLLIDERPEEVTDMQRSTHGEVFYSTFDEAPENHTRLSEMVLDCAQRQVEMGKDVVILLDSITRLARAYNLVIPPTGRSLSGGLDPGALLKPKKFFGSARNIEFGGSLTIIATALVDTGSRLDDIIYEEFKGTGNMELHLDRRLSERRVFPAIDINRSGTRRDDLLYTPKEAEGALQIRRTLASGSTQDATEQLMLLMEKTSNNEQLTERIKGWLAVLNK